MQRLYGFVSIRKASSLGTPQRSGKFEEGGSRRAGKSASTGDGEFRRDSCKVGPQNHPPTGQAGHAGSSARDVVMTKRAQNAVPLQMGCNV